jgi:hypothetical protein
MAAGKETLEAPGIRPLGKPWARAVSDHDLRRRRTALVAQATSRVAHPALAYLGPILAALWLAFIVSLLVGAPAAPESYTPPLWVDVVLTAFWLALVVAALAGLGRLARTGYAASFAASAACLGLAVACTVTDHHTGGWWAYELGGALALGWLSALGLQRARASRSRD